jgi:hypothetical protein
MIRRLMVVVMVLVGLALIPATIGRSEVVLGAEPALTATFITAYARGDLLSADGVASPLYRAEWARRGLSLQNRYDLLPTSFKAAAHFREWLHFNYVGGVVDRGGFGHLLYAARSTAELADSAVTVWRVDSDPDGRVIWVEMVYLFSQGTSTVSSITSDRDDSILLLPAALRSIHPRFLIGVRSLEGHEGYYAIELRPAETRDVTPPSGLLFFAIDENGVMRPGAWTFGQSHSESVLYGYRNSVVEVDVPAAVAKLRTSYLGSLP